VNLVEEVAVLIMKYNIEYYSAIFISRIVLLSIVILLSILGNYLIRKSILKLIPDYLEKSKLDWTNIMKKYKLFVRLSHIVPAIIIYLFASAFPVYKEWMQRFAGTYIIVIGVFLSDSILNSIEEIYRTYSISKLKPIKGYIQVLKIFIVVVAIILGVSTLLDKSPFIFLSGIGALTAVFILIFKDSLLGLVAGIQLSANDMLRLGDWIEMPKFGADGDVIEISLNTVKVQNFDKTITTIPSYALISDYFKNWRGMQESGGRRIKRSIYIDTTSINFATQKDIEEYKKIQFLSKYIETKEKEISEYNKKLKGDPSIFLNQRHMTNIGTFRAYIENYLKNHPKIRSDMTQVVRQLPSCESGLPIEIYAFTYDIDVINYEAVQSDVFDHLFSIIPLFGLRVFQQPSGYDMRKTFH
jgi:miniconductance mechanosensitive channel